MIPINLTLEQWQQVLNLLAQQPFHLVNGLISQIQGQAQNHLQNQNHQGSLPLGSGNGADPDVLTGTH